jgi:hypothetical protein
VGRVVARSPQTHLKSTGSSPSGRVELAPDTCLLARHELTDIAERQSGRRR